MRLLIKQRIFSWFDSYDIHYEDGSVAFTVKGQLSWGHILNIYSAGSYIGRIKEKIFTLMPKYELYRGEQYIGEISKDLTFFSQNYSVDYNGWSVKGDFLGWNYNIIDGNGNIVAEINIEIFNWADTYSLNVHNPADIFGVLAVVLAIDAATCSSN